VDFAPPGADVWAPDFPALPAIDEAPAESAPAGAPEPAAVAEPVAALAAFTPQGAPAFAPAVAEPAEHPADSVAGGAVAPDASGQAPGAVVAGGDEQAGPVTELPVPEGGDLGLVAAFGDGRPAFGSSIPPFGGTGAPGLGRPPAWESGRGADARFGPPYPDGFGPIDDGPDSGVAVFEPGASGRGFAPAVAASGPDAQGGDGEAPSPAPGPAARFLPPKRTGLTRRRAASSTPAAPAASFTAAFAPAEEPAPDLRGQALAELSNLAGRRAQEAPRRRSAEGASGGARRAGREAEELRALLTSLSAAGAAPASLGGGQA
jgi:hypothetical protein